jgi:hypothetical protein
MVDVVYGECRASYPNQGNPLVHIHHIRREKHGNGIAIKVYGEMKIAAKEFVWARELLLNTIKVLLLTVETGNHAHYHAQKFVGDKGQYDNYASIDVFDEGDTEQTAGNGPSDGSIWLNFEALGE